MGEKNDLHAHAAFDGAKRADCVFDRCEPEEGPVYLEGRLVLSLSFQGGCADVCTEGAGDLIERYRLWDNLADKWCDSLEVLRFEQMDVVVCPDPEAHIIWQGAVDTRAHAIPVPDLDGAGMAANRRCDLCWRRV